MTDDMTPASLDRLLALTAVAVVATGGLTLRAGTAAVSWIYGIHALVAGALACFIVAKVRSSVPRAIARGDRTRLVLGLVLSLVATAGLAGGYAWVLDAQLPSIGRWSVMTLHAWTGIVLLPVLFVHLLPRRWRLLRPGPNAAAAAGRRLLSRRALLVGGGLAGVAFGLTQAADLVDRLVGSPRRFTGSRSLPTGGIPPSTTFLLDEVPSIDTASWRVRVHGRLARPVDFTLRDLAKLGETDIEATLDCTSGWALQTTWHGIPLGAVLDAAGVARDAGEVTVRSVTGWVVSLPLAEGRECLLATGVAGVPLPVANGAPCRLVVPSRRGVDWVKWVTEIEVA